MLIALFDCKWIFTRPICGSTLPHRAPTALERGCQGENVHSTGFCIKTPCQHTGFVWSETSKWKQNGSGPLSDLHPQISSLWFFLLSDMKMQLKQGRIKEDPAILSTVGEDLGLVYGFQTELLWRGQQCVLLRQGYNCYIAPAQKLWLLTHNFIWSKKVKQFH